MKYLNLGAFVSIALLSTSLLATPVNINSASAKSIAIALNGIGLSKAEAIVAYRKQNGEFLMVKDLLKVKGIGNATLDKNNKDIRIK
ncbi:MAG: helix-hairpin-helix domain-containing protein [Gammaproteobacteria bacterium]|nr:helix-hairpin-helix domain-containing protein [Gammaproteobacteria bacterium]